MMKSNSFEYFLNAIHYCLWLGDMKFGDFMGKIVARLLSPIPKYLFTEKYKKECYERQSKEQKNLDKLLYDKETGYHICSANHWFGYFYSGYPSVISFILGGFAFRELGDLTTIVKLAITFIPTGLCYIPAYKAVFTDDRYLKYFKQFEKKDERWRKKWKRITIAFCFGSAIMTIFGIFVMFIIATW